MCAQERVNTSDNAWELMVPEAVADLVKQRSFFDYQASRAES